MYRAAAGRPSSCSVLYLMSSIKPILSPLGLGIMAPSDGVTGLMVQRLKLTHSDTSLEIGSWPTDSIVPRNVIHTHGLNRLVIPHMFSA